MESLLWNFSLKELIKFDMHFRNINFLILLFNYTDNCVKS